MRDLQALLDRLSSLRPPLKQKRCIIGFDGFTDEIIDVVDVRKDVFSFTPIETMEAFGQRIVDAAGQSCNIEFVRRKTKVGGNAPIMACALAQGGYDITFIGAVGQGVVEPLFEDMANQCEQVVPLCLSGHTDALEFVDGKVMLGKMGQLPALSFESLLEQLPKEKLIAMFDEADLFASCNWTMMPGITDLWRKLLSEVMVACKKRQRWMFVDLADPKKRSSQDLQEALFVLQSMGDVFDVVLGLNLSEASSILEEKVEDSEDSLKVAAASIEKRLGLEQVVIHGIRGAAVATTDTVDYTEGFFCPKPVCSTGGGDNFNAGYCQGLLLDLLPQESLALGVATSGYYVANGKSPSLADLSTLK